MNLQFHLSLLAGLAVLSISTLRCGGLAAQDQKPQGDKIALRTGAAKDTEVWFKTTSTMSQKIDMGGSEVEVAFNTELIISTKVVGATEDGSLTVEVQIAAIRGMTALPGMGEVEFDSTSKDGNDDETGLGKAFVAIAGRKLTATVAPHGRVTKLDGAKEAAEAAAGEANPMAAGLVRGVLSEESLKVSVQRLFGRLPRNPVAVGESWDGEHEPASGRNPVETKSKCTLAKASADTAEITMAGTVTKQAVPAAKDGDKGGNQEAMKNVKVENGTLKGRFVLSRKDGMVTESSEESAVDLLNVPGPMGEMSVHQTGKATVERTTADAAKPKAKEPKKDEAKAGKDVKEETKEGK